MAELDRIFAQFARAKPYQGRAADGFGLGLPATYGPAPASRRAAINVSAGVRTLTTTAWARVTLDDHHHGGVNDRQVCAGQCR
jgi:hypothetical protein